LAEGQRIDALELWCWRRLLRAPWTARRSNQSILKEINPEYSLEGLMLRLQYFGHLMCRADSLGKTEGKRAHSEKEASEERKAVGYGRNEGYVWQKQEAGVGGVERKAEGSGSQRALALYLGAWH